MSDFRQQYDNLVQLARGEDTTAGVVLQSTETQAKTAPDDKADAWGVAGRVEAHRRIVTGLTDLYERKNRDYGDSFHKTYLEEGYAMSRIRLSDKLERFKQLSKGNGQRVKDESIRDTLLDLANYAVMTVIEMDREAQP